jgi:hypothetical protein
MGVLSFAVVFAVDKKARDYPRAFESLVQASP